jgi:hypothetical protein
VGPRAGLNAVAKRKILCPCREPNPGSPAHSLLTIFIPDPSSRKSKPKFAVKQRYITHALSMNTFSVTQKPCVKNCPWHDITRGTQGHIVLGKGDLGTPLFKLCDCVVPGH